MATAKELLAVAAKQIGVCENPPGSNTVRYNTWYYGREVSGNGYPWCMVFVQWVFDQAGVALPKRTASCGDLVRAAQAAGCWVTKDYQPGDVVIYDFPGGAATDHTGIIESVAAANMVAIEGNTSEAGSQSNGGMVCRKTRPLSQAVGAVRPAYEIEEDDDMDVERFTELWLEMRKSLQDNDSSAYSAPAREWAISNGLIQGGSSADFNGMWEDYITREQFVTVLYRFAQMVGKS